jgi:hypothetical protein
MSLTKLFLAGNNLVIPGQGEFGYCNSGKGRKNTLAGFWADI